MIYYFRTIKIMQPQLLFKQEMIGSYHKFIKLMFYILVTFPLGGYIYFCVFIICKTVKKINTALFNCVEQIPKSKDYFYEYAMRRSMDTLHWYKMENDKLEFSN